MKTRCPNCQTSFRITPEQLKARFGKVRCGQCQTVFNALDSLLDESSVLTPAAPAPSSSQVPAPQAFRPAAQPPAAPASASLTVHASSLPASSLPASSLPASSLPASSLPASSLPASSLPASPPPAHMPAEHFSAIPATASLQPEESFAPHDDNAGADEAMAEARTDVETEVLSESEARELGKATGLIFPRETTAIPGYSKWVEGLMTGPVSLPDEKVARWPFIVAALLLLLALAGQLVFRFRSEIAITTPSLRPALELLCQAFDADIPLPRHVELVSIETSDLQSDPTHTNLLVLNATLRNRAGYGQAYPSLELSLTDTQDAAIARRVFPPGEYLPAKSAADKPFAANSDVAVRIWIEVGEIRAAGYRLYVFYP